MIENIFYYELWLEMFMITGMKMKWGSSMETKYGFDSSRKCNCI